MAKERLFKGDTVQTGLGYIEILGLHAIGQVDCNVYEYNCETEEDELVQENAILTYSDIEREMKEFDGNNHSVIYWE